MNNDTREDIQIELADVCNNLDELERSMIIIHTSHYEEKSWLVHQLEKKSIVFEEKESKVREFIVKN
jgi:hypothetical protein